MTYIQEKKLGFNKENVLVVENAGLIKDIKSFKESIESYPGILNSTLVSDLPGDFFNGNMIGRNPDLDPNRYNFRRICVDDDFAETMGIEMKEGRFFNKNLASDSLSTIISESGVIEMGLVNPIGEIITEGVNEPMTIIGVFKDFHNTTFRNKIYPLLIMPSGTFHQNKIAIKYHSNNKKAIINTVRKEWDNYTVDIPFDYYHLDNQIQALHKQEHVTMKTFTAFAILSILIATLGLLGLSSYTTEQRTKEIGIRRTLGASVMEIMKMMNKNFLRWILIALVIASPIAWYTMSKWLENFVYRAHMDIWIFIGAGLLSIIIAVLTISLQSLKTARRNPVDSLRYE